MIKSVVKINSKLLMTISLLLILSVITYSVIAQTDEPVDSEREGVQDAPLVADRVVTLNPLYHFAGVLNAEGVEGTAIMCTNIDPTTSTVIEVKLFNYNGSQVDTASLDTAPLRTITFESTQILFFTADSLMDSPSIEQGYGLISTEHKNVVCTVQVMDPAHNPPLWIESLPLYGRGTCCSFLPVILN